MKDFKIIEGSEYFRFHVITPNGPIKFKTLPEAKSKAKDVCRDIEDSTGLDIPVIISDRLNKKFIYTHSDIRGKS